MNKYIPNVDHFAETCEKNDLTMGYTSRDLISDRYIPIIGMEIHVELKTKSKMFCQCDADYFGKEPNTNTCPVCLGLPGALPVPNKKAIEWTIKLARALNCTISEISKFDRKHYSYPDLPKGYQISQYDEPIGRNGELRITNDELRIGKNFRIHRIHLEEDTGKSNHAGSESKIDFNRSGVPLVEIVTEPDFRNSDDVKTFLEELYTIIRYLDISDADMEKGSMRMEPNISVKLLGNSKDSVTSSFPASARPSEDGAARVSGTLELVPPIELREEELPPYKVEVKNINSFRYVKQAIDFEVKRHIEILEKGETPVQETRGFNEKNVSTYSQRTKENAGDYRYFPEPDIPPLYLDEKMVKEIEKEIPELPGQKVERFIKKFAIKYNDAFILTRERNNTQRFEEIITNDELRKTKEAYKLENIEKSIASYIINKRLPLNVSVEEFVAKAIDLLKPKETDNNLLEKVVGEVIATNAKVVSDYKSGKENSIMFLVGQVMKEMKGQADAILVRETLAKKMAE